MEDGLVDDLLNLLVGDGRLLLEGVEGSAALDRLEELLGYHLVGCCGERIQLL